MVCFCVPALLCFPFGKSIEKFLHNENGPVAALSIDCLKVTFARKQQPLKMYHLRHRLRIFLFRRKVILRSQGIQVFVFLTIPRFTKSVMS